MSYFNGPADPYDFEDNEAEVQPTPFASTKLKLGILLLIVGVVGSTFAANISLSGGRKEFGQGIFQIKACDQWVGVGLTTGQGAQNSYVANVRIIGLDPRACKGTIFRIKFFASGSNTAMNMYYGAGPSGGMSDSVTATSLVLKLTNTVYSGSNMTDYNNYAGNAITLIDPQGRDAGYADNFEFIDYTANVGEWDVILTYPLAVATAVSNVTIETAKYS